jgi:hypothetical protein
MIKVSQGARARLADVRRQMLAALMREHGAGGAVGLGSYPTVTFQCSSTTLYQVYDRIR